jgi:luciferase family oxidoreductase group 1
VGEVLAWLDGGFAQGDQRSEVSLIGAASGGPQPWLLGSSTSSAMLAARLGLPYSFAAFFNPDGAVAALRAYRACFTPSSSPSGVAAPLTMLAVNACCADTHRDADRLRASVELFYSPGPDVERRPLASVDVAVAALGGVPEPSRPSGGSWPRHLSGSPDHLLTLLDQLVAETGADELMIQDLIADPTDRLRSYELIAKAFGAWPVSVDHRGTA